jgi:glucokinase
LLSAGIDVGGTKCLGVVIDDGGIVLREEKWRTPRGGEALLDAMADLANALRPWDSLGVGVAGLITRHGVLRAAPNLHGVEELDVVAGLHDRLGVTVAADNDATCAALAEWMMGAAQSTRDAVLVTLGTGIGGGNIVDGRVARGVNGFAGEPGHMVVQPDGPPCVCGRRGCWERYASGAGLVRFAREAAEAGRIDHVVELAGGDPEDVRGEHLDAAARLGDEGALWVFDTFAWWVALGLVNITNLLDPEMLVIGGGLAEVADLYIAGVRTHFAELLYSASSRPYPRVEVARHGERAGAVGAALLGRDNEVVA